MAPIWVPESPWGLENTPFHWRVLSLPLCKMKLIVQDSWRIDCHPWRGKGLIKCKVGAGVIFSSFYCLPLPLLFFFFPTSSEGLLCLSTPALQRNSSQMLHILSLRPLAFKYSGDNVFYFLVGTEPKNKVQRTHDNHLMYWPAHEFILVKFRCVLYSRKPKHPWWAVTEALPGPFGNKMWLTSLCRMEMRNNWS